MVKPRKLIRDGRRRYKGLSAVVSLLYGVDTELGKEWKLEEFRHWQAGEIPTAQLFC